MWREYSNTKAPFELFACPNKRRVSFSAIRTSNSNIVKSLYLKKGTKT